MRNTVKRVSQPGFRPSPEESYDFFTRSWGGGDSLEGGQPLAAHQRPPAAEATDDEDEEEEDTTVGGTHDKVSVLYFHLRNTTLLQGLF